MRGGYLIIDLKNKPLEDGVGVVYEGVYERIEATKKPVRICNVNIDGTEIRDVDLTFIGLVDSGYAAAFVTGSTSYNISITDTDVVTIKLGE